MQPESPTHESSPLNRTYLLTIANNNWPTPLTQKVGVVELETQQVVYFLISGKVTNAPESEERVYPLLTSLETSCENCTFHRPTHTSPFIETKTGLTCVKWVTSQIQMRIRLPSKDGKTLEPGCICPAYTWARDAESWVNIADSRPLVAIWVHGKNGVTHQWVIYNTILIYTDRVVLTNDSGAEAQVSRSEFTELLRVH